MNRIRTRIVTALAAVVLLSGVTASALFRTQDKPEPKPSDKTSGAEAAIRKTSEAYAEAFNKGDLDAVMALWTADADYVNDEGKTFRGRNAITAEFKRLLTTFKGYQLGFRITGLRFPRPDVALEDGVARIVSPAGEASSSRYTAVWVKDGDKWLLSSVRDLPGDAEEKISAAQRLKALSWLVGEWTGVGPKSETRLVCSWATNHSFLLLDYTIRKTDGEVGQAQMRIGWDPANHVYRSWLFDSAGGFGEAVWSRDGHRWTGTVEGTLPDGRGAAGVNVFHFVDENTFTWLAKDRTIDGQPVADVEVKFTRKGSK